MAKYRVTIEFTTRLSREIEANSAEDAEQYAESMYQEYTQGQKTHLVSTERRRNVDLLSGGPSGRFQPAVDFNPLGSSHQEPGHS
jgi:hypothetical protein